VLKFGTPTERMNVVAARPQHDAFAIDDAMIVAPGDADRSILYQRIARRGRGQMPPLVSSRIDEQAVRLMREWITPMKPARPLVQVWRMDDFADVLDKTKSGRSPMAGQAAFREMGCNQCHRMGGEGGSVGPDLTGIARRQSAAELLRSILLPSDAIADEYATHEIVTSAGTIVTGRIEREDETAIVIRPQSQELMGETVRVLKSEVVSRRRLPLSNMPTGIVNVLKREELLDLLAYLLSDAPAAAVGK
jgi:putative heme-binding domain-containing protein